MSSSIVLSESVEDHFFCVRQLDVDCLSAYCSLNSWEAVLLKELIMDKQPSFYSRGVYLHYGGCWYTVLCTTKRKTIDFLWGQSVWKCARLSSLYNLLCQDGKDTKQKWRAARGTLWQLPSSVCTPNRWKHFDFRLCPTTCCMFVCLKLTEVVTCPAGVQHSGRWCFISGHHGHDFFTGLATMGPQQDLSVSFVVR